MQRKLWALVQPATRGRTRCRSSLVITLCVPLLPERETAGFAEKNVILQLLGFVMAVDRRTDTNLVSTFMLASISTCSLHRVIMWPYTAHTPLCKRNLHGFLGWIESQQAARQTDTVSNTLLIEFSCRLFAKAEIAVEILFVVQQDLKAQRILKHNVLDDIMPRFANAEINNESCIFCVIL